MIAEVSEKLKTIFDEFKAQFGYELKELVSDDDVLLGRTYIDYMVFERIAEGHHHVLILEDHTWEKSCEDFDPKNHPWDVGDWLIFSYLKDDVRDWFGHFTDTRYPLTYTEYKMIEKIILQIEKEQTEGNDKE